MLPAPGIQKSPKRPWMGGGEGSTYISKYLKSWGVNQSSDQANQANLPKYGESHSSCPHLADLNIIYISMNVPKVDKNLDSNNIF